MLGRWVGGRKKKTPVGAGVFALFRGLPAVEQEAEANQTHR